MNKIIILPLELENDDRKVYSFALEFSMRIQSDVLILATYNIPSNYPYSSREKRNVIINEKKEEIHFKLLELMGYYQCQFNLWQGGTTSEVKAIISKGSITKAISSAIMNNKDSILLLQRNHYSKIGLSEETISQLYLTNTKIIILPVDLDFFEPLPELDRSFFNVQKELMFERLLKDSEIYSMPDDINMFKRDSLPTEYV